MENKGENIELISEANRVRASDPLLLNIAGQGNYHCRGSPTDDTGMQASTRPAQFKRNGGTHLKTRQFTAIVGDFIPEYRD